MGNNGYLDARRRLLGAGVTTARNILTGHEIDLPSRGSVVTVRYDNLVSPGMSVADSAWEKSAVTGIVSGYDADWDVLATRQGNRGVCWHAVMKILSTEGREVSVPCSHVTEVEHDPSVPSPVREALSFIHGEVERRRPLYERIARLNKEIRNIQAEIDARDEIVRHLCDILASGSGSVGEGREQVSAGSMTV